MKSVFISCLTIIHEDKDSELDRIIFTNGLKVDARVVEKTSWENKFKRDDYVERPTQVVCPAMMKTKWSFALTLRLFVLNNDGVRKPSR